MGPVGNDLAGVGGVPTEEADDPDEDENDDDADPTLLTLDFALCDGGAAENAPPLAWSPFHFFPAACPILCMRSLLFVVGKGGASSPSIALGRALRSDRLFARACPGGVTVLSR